MRLRLKVATVQVPQTSVGANGLPEPNLHATAYCSFRNKPALQHIANNVTPLLEEAHMRTVGITLTYDPNKVTKGEAWQKVVDDVATLHHVLSNQPEVMLVLSAIEIHEASHARRKKFTPKVPLDMNNPAFYGVESEQIRLKREERDKVEDLLRDARQGLTDMEVRQRLKRFDEENGFLTTRRTTKNGRTLVLDEATHFPVEWDHPEDKAPHPRYWVVKKIDDALDITDTLEGYPHIHAAVGHGNITGVYTDPIVWAKLLAPPTLTASDIQIGAKKGKGRRPRWDVPEALLGYVLKNCRHKAVHEMLGDRKGWHTVLNVIKTPARLAEALKELERHNCLMTIMDPKVVGVPAQVQLKLTRKPGDKKYDQAQGRVISYMQANSIALYDGKLYQRVRGSRMTWDLWEKGNPRAGDILTFLGCCMSVDDNCSLIIPHHKAIMEFMKNPGQSVYPRVNLDCQWVEYADFYLFMGEGVITRTNERHPCFRYHPKITLEMVQNMCHASSSTGCSGATGATGAIEVVRPTKFLQIIENSHSDEKTQKGLMGDLYLLLLPRTGKKGGVYLLGPPNSAKTTLIDAVARILPMSKRAVLTSSDHAFEVVPNVYLVIMDEGEGTHKVSEGRILRLLEGDSEMGINPKHKTNYTALTNVNVAIMSNHNLFEEDAMTTGDLVSTKVRTKTAFLARLKVYEFRTMANATPTGKREVMMEMEDGKVLLWLCRNYFGGFKFIDDPEEVEKIYNHWLEDHPERDDKLPEILPLPKILPLMRQSETGQA